MSERPTIGFLEPGGEEELEKLPLHLRSGLHDYVLYGCATGRFLQAVIENDLNQAVCRMNPAEFDVLRAVVLWLYNYTPSPCYGSPEAYRNWVEKGSMECPRD